MLRKIVIYISFVCFFLFSFAQNKSIISGRVVDENGKSLELVNIGVVNLDKPIGTTTDASGKYSLSLPIDKDLKLVVSFMGYSTEQLTIKLKKDEKRQLDFTLKRKSETLGTVEIKGDN